MSIGAFLVIAMHTTVVIVYFSMPDEAAWFPLLLDYPTCFGCYWGISMTLLWNGYVALLAAHGIC